VPATRRFPWGLALLGALVVAGVLATHFGVIDWRDSAEWARSHSHRWWLPFAIVATMTLLFAFALPGMTMVWVAGIIYAPPVGVALVMTGGLAGALAAHHIAGTAGGAWAQERRDHRLMRLLRTRSDFLTLAAVRTLPTFPHSVINYSAGVLGVPLARFLTASALGLALKASVYVTAIHNAAHGGAVEDAFSLGVVAPLIVLALLFLVAAFARKRWGIGVKSNP
jgi:uncharacterized membrane protein YdjX (TVP38/TMEM64 family)